MNETEVLKCPKCGGEMEIGYMRDAPWWRKGTSMWQVGFGSRVYAYKCVVCGYIELWGKEDGTEPERKYRLLRNKSTRGMNHE